jgi:membrane-bound ClpP family serine protease
VRVVDAFLSEPAVVYLAYTLAAALILVEIALPTFGIAGAAAALLTVITVLGLAEQDNPWWPTLILASVGVALWAVGIARNTRSRTTAIAAASCFAGGSLAFAVSSDSALTLAIALVASVAGPLTYPRLAGATARLMGQPATTGMESLVGRQGKVAKWHGQHGTVRVEGTFWSAVSKGALAPSVGDTVEVTGFVGNELEVAPRAIYGAGDGR